MSLKNERLLYVARNFQTGLTDVKAVIRRNGVVVATNVALTEVASGTNPGEYELLLTPTMITNYGGAGYFDFYVDSASKPAPATASRWILINDSDDLAVAMSSLDGKTSSVLSIVSDANYGNAALRAVLDTISGMVSNIQNNTRFTASVPSMFIRPGNGSTPFKIGAQLFDEAGNPEDPDANMSVIFKDAAGVDINTSFGLASGPQAMTKDSVGVYSLPVSVASNAQLRPDVKIEFFYTENTVAFFQSRDSAVIADVQSSGFAQQATLLSAMGDGFNSSVNSLVVISELLNAIEGAGFATGTDSLKVIRTNIDAAVAAIEGVGFASNADSLHALSNLLRDASSGLAALKTAIVNGTDEVKGTGFTQGVDDLKSISDRVYTGGRMH